MSVKALLACAGLGILFPAHCSVEAAVTYDAERNAIRVRDYLRSFPCALKGLRAADRMNGWGKVTHDEASDTYTVACHLVIGDNDGTDTYFQVGSVERPEEALVMQGNIIVSPYWIKGRNADADVLVASKKVNRLTLGDPKDNSVSATLKFDCTEERKFTVYVGVYGIEAGKVKGGRGGQLHVHNSTITALDQKPGFEFSTPSKHAAMVLSGDSIVFDGATLSWAAGYMAYGIPGSAKVANTVFEHGKSVTYGGTGHHRWTGCTFRNLECAIFDSGGLCMTLTRCTFENNIRNWSLPYTRDGLTCIDCTVGSPERPDHYASWVSPRTHERQYPTFTAKRHIIVDVVDEEGKPIPDARVTVTCDQGALEAVENGEQTTNAAGRTPAQGEEQPVLLTEMVKQATDTPSTPEVREYDFSIQVSADGFAPNSVNDFRPTSGWKVVRIVLAKK